jgi:histidinol-phosphate phosphatase family protein
MVMNSDRAVFLDKDGTLIENVPYNVAPDLIRLTPGAGEGLALLHQRGYRLFVVSNQPGVAFGHFPESALAAVNDRLRELLAAHGITLSGFTYCPHHPHGRVAPYARVCDCRKPAAGMIVTAARMHGLDLTRCWLVGDILDDVEAGRRAGCRTILIDNGNETEWVLPPDRQPHHTATDLAQAAQIIVGEAVPERSLGPCHTRVAALGELNVNSQEVIYER